MKVTIIGAGAIGGLFGAHLTYAGENVTLVDIRDDLIATVQKEGLKIDTPSGETKDVKVKIIKNNDISSVGISDLVIIAVKSFATKNAINNALPVIGKDTYAMSVQNGAGNVETIAGIMGDNSRVIGGVFLSVVTPLKLNHFSWVYGTGGLRIGPINGVMVPKIEEVANIFRRAGIETVISTKVQDLIWNKRKRSINRIFPVLLKYVKLKPINQIEEA